MKSVDIEKILAILAGRKIGEKKVGGSKKNCFPPWDLLFVKIFEKRPKVGVGGRGNLASEERKKEKNYPRRNLMRI